MALIRRAKAIANVAEAEKRDAERLRRAEQRWGQAITRDGRRYYFDKIERGPGQGGCRANPEIGAAVTGRVPRQAAAQPARQHRKIPVILFYPLSVWDRRIKK